VLASGARVTLAEEGSGLTHITAAIERDKQVSECFQSAHSSGHLATSQQLNVLITMDEERNRAADIIAHVKQVGSALKDHLTCSEFAIPIS
jgi:hypothetical protein